MRIGFIGAGGTGKTTLARVLAEKLNLPAPVSTTRATFAKFGKVQTDMATMPVAERWQIQLANFHAKMALDRETPEGIFDCTLLDHLMYCLLYCYEIIPDVILKNMTHQVVDNLQGYDHLYYFPIYPWDSNLDDGFRDATAANRELQNYILMGFIRRWQISSYVMPNIPVSARVDYILRDVQPKK